MVTIVRKHTVEYRTRGAVVPHADFPTGTRVTMEVVVQRHPDGRVQLNDRNGSSVAMFPRANRVVDGQTVILTRIFANRDDYGEWWDSFTVERT